ncbi:MAG: hypothetical protein ABSF09_02750 [Candidatus Bathyarchaeia archaeon]
MRGEETTQLVVALSGASGAIYAVHLSQLEARKHGIGKSPLHYLRKSVRSDRSFYVQKHILARISRNQ